MCKARWPLDPGGHAIAIAQANMEQPPDTPKEQSSLLLVFVVMLFISGSFSNYSEISVVYENRVGSSQAPRDQPMWALLEQYCHSIKTLANLSGSNAGSGCSQPSLAALFPVKDGKKA
ncbi:hypothetical protein MJG53_006461 [Ovis ammon polii x Ovis aries]|uniref:Uncharacterized protein n=1 Tax=Ovis ammon polii x Ovis aries TaxID=2918886 RepID=A0ACB9V4W2_9CETA|nr:hypothetical protein MJG53_006461 [Ovis ammon polii x Ovis aries]